MAHTFGISPAADNAWLEFIGYPDLDRIDKARLLRSGARPDDWLSNNFRSSPVPRALVAAVRNNSRRRLVSALKHTEATLVHLGDLAAPRGEGYPALLGGLQDAPLALFVVGNTHALALPAVAVVGTRHPSRDGARLAEQLGYELAGAGFAVVSGLALGVDAAAHRGALRAGGVTVAVMATGVDRVYPAVHRQLAADICRSGALVSEFSPGVAPRRHHFPRRNRTISGLSLATVVVEAGRPSGSLITASAAAQQGREVFAAPWSLYHPGGEGCVHLLADGAQLLDTPRRLIDSLRMSVQGWLDIEVGRTPSQPLGGAARPTPNLPDDAQHLLNWLGDAEMDLGDFMQGSSVSAPRLRTLLTDLELQGFIEQTAAGYRRLR